MQKGFRAILILVILAFLAIILFIPLPIYQKEIIPGGPCTMRWPVGDCPTTGRGRWVLGPSLWERFWSKQKLLPPPLTETSLSPDPTTNLSRDEVLRDWKTYKNEELGISFKYPSDWNLQSRKVVQFPPELDFMITLTANNRLVGTIDYYRNPENLSLEAFENYLIKTDKSGLHMPVFLTTDEAVTLANGATVYSRRTLCGPPAIDECQIYVFPYKDKILIFTDFLRYNQVIKLPAQNEVFDQILSTFRFIE